tara:strand:- start:16 stop:180 length:165 start_codon:yes stop_codon:yes gene_type:complete
MEELTKLEVITIVSIARAMKEECEKYEIEEDVAKELIFCVVEEITRDMIERRNF